LFSTLILFFILSLLHFSYVHISLCHAFAAWTCFLLRLLSLNSITLPAANHTYLILRSCVELQHFKHQDTNKIHKSLTLL
jgi:hypothetical protein